MMNEARWAKTAVCALLTDGTEFTITSDDGGVATWDIVFHTDEPPLTKQQIIDKVAELKAEYDSQAYARSRATEYPPITDYIDGVVKGDQAQIDAYIAACQAVKAKYPKV